VLGVLEFRSNNAVHRPVLNAIDWLRRTGEDSRELSGRKMVFHSTGSCHPNGAT